MKHSNRFNIGTMKLTRKWYVWHHWTCYHSEANLVEFNFLRCVLVLFSKCLCLFMQGLIPSWGFSTETRSCLDASSCITLVQNWNFLFALVWKHSVSYRQQWPNSHAGHYVCCVVNPQRTNCLKAYCFLVSACVTDFLIVELDLSEVGPLLTDHLVSQQWLRT